MKPPRKRPAHARICNNWLVLLKTFTHQDKTGGSGLHLSGLSPGSYVLRASATLNGYSSPTVSVSFKVNRP